MTQPVLPRISAPRVRQPREEQMKCVTQHADIRMIHRRSHCPRVAFLLRCRAHPDLSRFVLARVKTVHALDEEGHIRSISSMSRTSTNHRCTTKVVPYH